MPDVRVLSVIALLLVAVGSTIYLQRSDRQNLSQTESPAQTSTRQDASPGPVASAKPVHRPQAANQAVHAESARGTQRVELPATSQAARAKSTVRNGDAPPPVNGRLQAGNVGSGSETNRPFPTSESVRHDCQGTSAGVGICEAVMQLLQKFAEEPRDPGWAPDTEARIRAFVESEGGKFAIRALECRTSVCAVEVESVHGPYLGVDYQTQVDNGLEDSVASFGDEKHTLGQKVTVTLRLLERAYDR